MEWETRRKNKSEKNIINTIFIKNHFVRQFKKTAKYFVGKYRFTNRSIEKRLIQLEIRCYRTLEDHVVIPVRQKF